jgi:hypothetical protein
VFKVLEVDELSRDVRHVLFVSSGHVLLYTTKVARRLMKLSLHSPVLFSSMIRRHRTGKLRLARHSGRSQGRIRSPRDLTRLWEQSVIEVNLGVQAVKL